MFIILLFNIVFEAMSYIIDASLPLNYLPLLECLNYVFLGRLQNEKYTPLISIQNLSLYVRRKNVILQLSKYIHKSSEFNI